MHHEHFIEKISERVVASAIANAERKTTGPIRVYVSHSNIADPVEAAQHRFHRQGLDHTPDRNAVLIFIAPKSRNFAIIGDQAIHQKCGDAFWQSVAIEMTSYFKQQDWTQGLLHGIQKAGELLAQHFPVQFNS